MMHDEQIAWILELNKALVTLGLVLDDGLPVGSSRIYYLNHNWNELQPETNQERAFD